MENGQSLPKSHGEKWRSISKITTKQNEGNRDIEPFLQKILFNPTLDLKANSKIIKLLQERIV